MFRRTFIGSLLGIPATLDKRRGVHPRLFLDAARLAELRAAVSGSHAALWGPVRERADAITGEVPPPYRETDNEEELWQREVGNRLPFLALAYAVTRERKYLDAARKWSLASCGYPNWGVKRFAGNDLAAAHQLLGLAVVYDWMHADLDDETRATIRNTLHTRGAVMFRGCATMYWRDQYLQNHLWVSITGLAAAAFAIFDEPGMTGDASLWLETVLAKYRRTEEALGPDGASQEGVSYWSYGVEYMLKFWHLAGELMGEKPTSAWWRLTSMYRLYVSLPRNSWNPLNTAVDFGDNPRKDNYGPDYLLRRLAALYKDGHAQWLAQELDRARSTSPTSRWLNLVWYDPRVPAQSPARLPTMRHFDDLGIVSARTDWSGGESLVVFKCGPAVGRHATRIFDHDPGAGHVHPDCNHFVLFGAGDWLIRDDGYSWKLTDQHNTLLVNGKGQLGEGRQWFSATQAIRQRLDPRILLAKSSPALDEIHGEAAPAYPAESGLGKFVRRVYFMKPDVLIVVDDIEADRERALELRFHPEYPGQRGEDGAVLCRGERSVLRIDPLTREGVDVTAGDLPARDRGGKPSTMYTVRLSANRRTWRNAVAFSWSASGGAPTRVRMETNADGWTFRTGSRVATVNW
jgi:hypothetical protein